MLPKTRAQVTEVVQIGGSGAAVALRSATFRDRGGRLQGVPLTVGRPGRSSSLRCGRSTAVPGGQGSQPRTNEKGGQRAWPLIMTWCPDKGAVNKRLDRAMSSSGRCTSLTRSSRRTRTGAGSAPQHGYKYPIAVAPGATVTMTIAASARGHVVIGNPYGPPAGVVAASYPACQPGQGQGWALVVQGFVFTDGRTRGCVTRTRRVGRE